jgi:hypothetical protein
MARHPFTEVAEAYGILRRGEELPYDYRLLFTRMVENGGLFMELLELVDKQRRYEAYMMILKRMLDGEELVCFEQDLADDLLNTLMMADRQIRVINAAQEYVATAVKRPLFSDVSFVTRAADRSPTLGH